MGNFVINKQDALEGLLSKEHYFQSLLQALYSKKILERNDMERIQLQLMKTLTEVVGYYTKNRSSSVKEETALQIISSIYYTIGLFLKNQSSIKETINLIQREDIKHLFAQGEVLLKTKVTECKKLYEIVREKKLKTENQAYNDTIDYGILLFFEKYDARFGSHETPGSIDYPLAISDEALVGIEYIHDYLNKLAIENKFCSNFDYREIEALLRGYSKDSYHMLINIYTLVLTNYLGCALAGKAGKSIDISQGERTYLKSILGNLSNVEFESLIKAAEERICNELCMVDENLIGYIKQTIPMLAQEIRSHLRMNTLKNIFITLSWSEKQKLDFKDGKSLKNIAFKHITEEIRDCSKVEEKIEIIKKELHSLSDIVDVLGADCIFDEEFDDIFKTLSDFEMALLMKHISNRTGWGTDYDTESEKEWEENFKKYFESLKEFKKKEIIRIADDIEL